MPDTNLDPVAAATARATSNNFGIRGGAVDGSEVDLWCACVANGQAPAEADANVRMLRARMPTKSELTSWRSSS